MMRETKTSNQILTASQVVVGLPTTQKKLCHFALTAAIEMTTTVSEYENVLQATYTGM